MRKVKIIKHSCVLLLTLPFWVTGAPSKTVSLGTGNFEPYFSTEMNRGIFSEIIIKVFDKIPEVSPELVSGLSNNELMLSYQRGLVDGIANVFDFIPNACLTNPVFRFQDVAVSNKKDAIVVNQLSDLTGKRIATYEGAKVFWGAQFVAAVADSEYVEVKEPPRQAQLLSASRVDISIGDLFIFIHSIHNNITPKKSLSEFNIHEIFPQKYSYMAFRDETLCGKFNKALGELKSSGEYENIYKSQLKQYGYRHPS